MGSATKKKPPAKKGGAKKPATKAKPKEVRYDTPEALAKYDQYTVKELEQKLDHLKATRFEFNQLTEKRKDAKKKFDAAQVEYEDALEERKKWKGQKPPGVQLEIPFERPTPDTGKPVQQEGGATIKGTGWYPEDLWKQFPIERWSIYGMTPSDAEKLKEGQLKKGTERHPITTVGELKDFCAPWANDPTRNRNYGDIKGIGAEGATRISDAELKFWAEWPNGLGDEFAKEKGWNPQSKKADTSADNAPDTGGGKQPAKGGGNRHKPGKPGSGKPSGKKPKPKPKAKPAKAATAGEPAGDGQPATLPFEQPAAEVPGEEPAPKAEVS